MDRIGLICFWRIFGGFLEDFWRMFGGFLEDFWRIFGGFLEDLGVLHFCTNLDGRVWLPRMTGVFSAKPGGWPANPPENLWSYRNHRVWRCLKYLNLPPMFIHLPPCSTAIYHAIYHDIPWLLRGFRWFQTSIFHGSSSLRSLPCQSLPLGLLLPSMRRVQSAVAGVTPKISQVNFFIRGMNAGKCWQIIQYIS